MVDNQLSEFKKGQIVDYNDCNLSLCDITKKFNHHCSSIDIFFQNYEKTKDYQKKKNL